MHKKECLRLQECGEIVASCIILGQLSEPGEDIFVHSSMYSIQLKGEDSVA